MDYIGFNSWLLEDQGMSKRSAKDVLSRCRRVCKWLNIEVITSNTSEDLLENSEYTNSSMFIKSQLKRAVSLWLEYNREN